MTTLSSITLLSLNPTAVGRGGGLLIAASSYFTLTNNLVAGNHATTEGDRAIARGRVYKPHVRPVFATLPSLTTMAAAARGHLHGANTSLAFTNTIIYGHQTAGITVTAGSTVTLDATLWANGTDWAGAGQIVTGTINVWGDPDFVNSEAGDYHIGPDSAAINAGVDAGVTTDIDGESRPSGFAPDLGADEFLLNRSPVMPHSPNPAHGATDVSLDQVLEWQSSDPDGDPITYTVAFGKDYPPTVVDSVTVTSYDPSRLDAGTVYYWIITASDGIVTHSRIYVGVWHYVNTGLSSFPSAGRSEPFQSHPQRRSPHPCWHVSDGLR